LAFKELVELAAPGLLCIYFIAVLFECSGFGNVVDVKINRKGVTRDLPVRIC